jgi:hypothetical protein
MNALFEVSYPQKVISPRKNQKIPETWFRSLRIRGEFVFYTLELNSFIHLKY